MAPATIALEFDPLVRIADRAVRLETIVLAVAILACLLIAAAIARRTPAGPDDPGPFVRGTRLRADDLLFVVLGAVPGAVVGGRLGHVLLHLDYYRDHLNAAVDPAQGSLHLTGAIAGGVLTGAVIARLLDGSIGRWLHVAALPLLLGIALGKVAMALGGDGQGVPTDRPWATAYLGDGLWGSLAPATPSHPAQLYEAAAAGLALIVVLGLLAWGLGRRRDGRIFAAAIGLWALGRFVVAFTWRDAEILGPLRADQVISLVVVGLAVLALWLGRDARRRGSGEPGVS